MDRRDFLARLSTLAAAGLATGLFNPAQLFAEEVSKKKMNVLFIAVDDLRPQMGCYGHKQMITPNMDKLAAEGALFERTYCQQAVCAPSRTSLLTGARPDTTKVYDLKTHFRTALPDVVTLPQHFMKNGYHSVGIGKIFHVSLNDDQSWSEPWIRPEGKRYALKESFQDKADTQLASASDAQDNPKYPRKLTTGTPYECADVADNAYQDGWTADKAVEVFKRIKDKPFFFGVGFYKPHLPFSSPKKYWDLYDPAKIDLAANPFAPKGVPPLAMHDFEELRPYIGIPEEGPIPDNMARNLIHAYYAATSYVDAQVGKVLDALEAEGFKDNTIVILWGDHGWQLGEHGLWSKHTNFEVATRSPMIIRVPGMKNSGVKINALTEFVDIYPTLCELTGLSLPDHLEGTSFKPLLENPDRSWKKAAFSQFRRGKMEFMGYTMRTDRYRYTEWRKMETGKPVAFEIYDHEKDPQENINLAAQEGHENLREELAKIMESGWRSAKPE